MSSFLAMAVSNDAAYHGSMSPQDPLPLVFFNSTNSVAPTLDAQAPHQASIVNLPPNSYFGQDSAPPVVTGSISASSFFPTAVPATQPSEAENRAPEMNATSSVAPVKPRKRSRKDEIDASFVLPEGTTRVSKPRQMADDTHWEGPVRKRSRHK